MRFTQEVSTKQNNSLDELTGIYNQQGFFTATEALLKEHPDNSFCLIYWNIRKFRVTNDLFGWESGDKVLIHWANTLREMLHGELAVYGRLEHDNFVCCVQESFLENNNWMKLGEISFSAGDTEYHFFSCCGLYKITDRTLPLSHMLDKARAAMETIKNNYMTLYAWYDDSMWNSLLEEQRMNNEFKTAIEEKQFKVYYQPICRATDGLITSAEALIRWVHPTRGMISPGAFIPLFEKNGFISILDRYVWDEVCAMQQSRLDQGLATVPVSVNVSRVEFYNPTLCEDIRDIAKKHNISPDLLKIEITESAYADNPKQVLDAVQKLHTYGFSVLMDDFGSGYSSLNMLKDLPIDVLKIDMRFLDDLDKSQKASIVLESIIRLAKWMKLSVVSEGVETKKEWEYLRSVECDAVQGYYFYKPMPQEDFMKLLDKTAENSTKLLFHNLPDIDESILEVFNQANTKESLLFYSMLGGMGLLEVYGDNVEIIRVNNGYYESVYGSIPRDHRVLNVPFQEPERSLILDQCRLAKTESRMQQFQIHHKLENGTYVWLSVKLRYIGGNPRQAIYLFTVDNIDAQKKAEQARYMTNYSSALLKIFDRVYHLNYATDSAEVLHTNTTGYLETNVQYPLSEFFNHFRTICFEEDAATVDAVQSKEALDAAFSGDQYPQLTIRYHVPTNGVLVETGAHFIKLDMPDHSTHYLCCVKKVH
ncbi:MAG: EAL domain-containing protein [Lachnospiraceae bacterium]|nr:EAL domain-containing protein [Lachnospiraceae bacterium]